MKNKRITIIIFALPVLALLLRPYVAYQIIETQNLTKDPVAANSLLQRLIKKKDEHHCDGIQEFLAIQCGQKRSAPLLPMFKNTTNLAVAAGNRAVVPESRIQNTVCRVCPHIKYYRLLSKFQI